MNLKLLFNFREKEFDRLLNKARCLNQKKFLLVWNRGLGDIALGVYRVVQKIRQTIPTAEITVLTREELAEGFAMLEGVSIIAVPGWKRGEPVQLLERLTSCGRKKEEFEVVLEKMDPTRWFKNDLGKFVPRLTWRPEYDGLWKKFNLTPNKNKYLAVHLHTETEKFYSYNKNWPVEKFKEVFNTLISEDPFLKIILLGLRKTTFEIHSQILDLRGETSILEMLSIIKNCCSLLIAPDGGILSLIYYLNVNFPITIISLWGDAHQGILKQSVPSPNHSLKHIPIIGQNKDINSITPAEVLEAVRCSLKETFQE